MYLDDGTREWLQEIEGMHQACDALDGEKLALPKKIARTKRPAAVAELNARLACVTKTHAETSAKLEEETANLFKNVFGVSRDSLVAVRRGTGKDSAPVVATNLVARYLADNTAVLFVHGASLCTTLNTGAPAHVVLSARESAGEQLVSVG